MAKPNSGVPVGRSGFPAPGVFLDEASKIPFPPRSSRTHSSSCVMTTWASSAARWSGERSCGSSTLVSSGPCRAWARSRRTVATSWACTAAHSWRPSGSSVVLSGARNSSCSYLARIHDSRSSLQDQGSTRKALGTPPPASQNLCPYPGDPLRLAHPQQPSPGSVPSRLPRRVPRGLGTAPRVALPHAVGHVVANGRQHQGQLPRPVVQVQRADAGQVCAQVAVDARTLDADERAQVQAGPRGVCGRSVDVGSQPGSTGIPAFTTSSEPHSLAPLLSPGTHWGPRSPRRLNSPWRSGSPGWPRLRFGCRFAAAESVGVGRVSASKSLPLLRRLCTPPTRLWPCRCQWLPAPGSAPEASPPPYLKLLP
uniref:Uncharacterized protein n=1 Tax=Callithrix jacchus TaxID=9483 RepID=A0A8I3W945_CALJA